MKSWWRKWRRRIKDAWRAGQRRWKNPIPRGSSVLTIEVTVANELLNTSDPESIVEFIADRAREQAAQAVSARLGLA